MRGWWRPPMVTVRQPPPLWFCCFCGRPLVVGSVVVFHYHLMKTLISIEFHRFSIQPSIFEEFHSHFPGPPGGTIPYGGRGLGTRNPRSYIRCCIHMSVSIHRSRAIQGWQYGLGGKVLATECSYGRPGSRSRVNLQKQ